MSQQKSIIKLTLIAALLILTACTNIPRIGSGSMSPENAQQLVAEGKFAEASEMYANLAKRSKDPISQQHYLLLAAEILIDNGQYTQGGQARIAAIPTTLAAPDLQDRLSILQSKEALISGDAESALELLPDPEKQYSSAHRARIYEVQANAYAVLGVPDEELNARVNLDDLLDTEEAKTKNAGLIWNLLQEQPNETLRLMTGKVHGDVYQGWLEFALILRSNTLNANHLTRQVSNWRQRFPNHPASGEFGNARLTEALAALPDERTADNIAVILPLSGKTALAASAIRDGLIAAYLESGETSGSPRLRFYDTEKSDIINRYQQAVDEGANLVIGPLKKRSVTQLAAQQTLPVPTLGLNYIDDRLQFPENLFQFGLLPEDEAHSAADRAQQHFYKSALVLRPDDKIGERLGAAFSESLENFGGRVLETVVLEKDTYDYSEQLRSSLHIDDSNQRFRTLQKIAGQTIKFEPAIRQDIDVIFIASDSRQARLLRPQLLFYRAKDIPLLASSRVNDGIVDTKKDRDLNGIVFSDSTWALNTQTPGNPIQDAINRNWPDSGRYARLFALGADAYNLLPYLSKLQSEEEFRFPGNTGDLSIDERNRIHRHLHWAIFEKGKAILYDGAVKPANEN